MKNRQHFHTFDALRFLAFFKVFLLHIPIFSFPAFNYLKKGGGIGVLFFFVLSGFLITYILLSERKTLGSIDLGKFFLRRILRIWPLYFLMVGFAFLTPWLLSWFHLSHTDEGYSPNLLVSIAFLENYRMMILQDHPNVSPLGVTWSLCIEEHFYIIWGLLLFFITPKKIPYLFGLLILLSFSARYVYSELEIPAIDILAYIDYFAYGALPAYLLISHQKNFNHWLSTISLQKKRLAIVITLLYVILSPNINYPFQHQLEPLVFGLLFMITICCILPDSNAIQLPDHHLLSRLGTYTYGMYLYHTIIINWMVHVFSFLHLSTDRTFFAFFFTIICFILTVLVSMISYHFFEKIFLRLKDKMKPLRNSTFDAT